MRAKYVYLLCRYAVSGQEMPLLKPWFETKLGLDLSQTSFSQVLGMHALQMITAVYRYLNIQQEIYSRVEG